MPHAAQYASSPSASALRERRAPSKIPAIVVSGATVLLLVAAGVSYDEAHDRADVIDHAVSAEVFEADREAIQTWNRRMVITASLAIVGAAASGFLWYRALAPVQVEVEPASSSVSLWFARQF